MPYWREDVADGHLAAERVAAGVDAHLRGLVGGRVDEHRHVQAGEAQCFRHSALVAEVRQGHDDAVDVVAVLPEEVGAGLGLVATLHGAVVRLAGADDDGVVALFLEHPEDLVAPGFCEVPREEPPVADDDAEGDPARRTAPGRGGRGRLFGRRGALRRKLAANVGLYLMESHFAPRECVQCDR